MKDTRGSAKIISRAAIFILISAALAISGVILYANLSTQPAQDTVRYTPDTIQVDPSQFADDTAAQQEQANALKLFDRDTTSAYAPGQATNINITFGGPINLKFIKVYGPASYYITVYSSTTGNNWSEVSGLSHIDLSRASQSWNKYTDSPTQSSALFRVKLEPSAGGTMTGVPELEFWADGTHLNIKDGGTLSATIDALGFNSFGKKFIASPVSADVAISRDSENTNIGNAVFYANVSGQASDFNRAWLVYDIKGLGSWIGAQHTINGMGSVMAWPVAGTDDWISQVEPINPDLIVNGNNVISFTLPAGSAVGYSVRNLALVVETDNGFNQISGIEPGDNSQANMLDGDVTTLWKPAGIGANAVFDLYRSIQAESIGINTGMNSIGFISISGCNSGNWGTVINSAKISSLQNGWSTLSAGGIFDKFSINVTGTAGTFGGIAEAAVCGSGIGTARSPGIVINYPDNGQYYGRAAYIKGFLPVPDNGSGLAQVMIGPNSVDLKDGVFSGIVSKEDVGLDSDADSTAWSVVVTALYPDGTKITRTVLLNNMLAAVDMSGLNNTSLAYGVGLKPGSTRKFNINGISIEADTTDNDKTKDIQVLSLEDRDLPPLDIGMVNVTGKHKGFRFLPHHTKFSKKIKLRIPYDKKKIPPGQTEKNIKTYYFNDYINKWLPVETVQVDKVNGMVESNTDHFTDFINATIVKPDNPQMANFNPNTIKDLKAALPGAGIALIDPPQGNPKGDASLSFKIDLPPGRHGMQPDTTVIYNSNSSEGIAGFGWDVAIKAVICDTRWGVPRYDPAIETETYMLDGEQLLPSARSNSPVARAVDKRFFSRVETKFDRIVRRGTGVNNYYWEVTDKEGTVNTYGADAASRVGPANAIFMWALTKSVDKNGNNIRYYYNQSELTSNGELILDHITYTGYSSGGIDNDGYYSVNFIYEPGNRPDMRMDCRGGFVKTTAKILDSIQVMYNNGGGMVRFYGFEYKTGIFNKELLSSIKQYDAGGNTIVAGGHTFYYYDDLLSANNQVFHNAPPFTGTINSLSYSSPLINGFGISALDDLLGPSSISGQFVKSSGESYNAYGGCKVCFSFLGCLGFSVNVNWGYSNNESNGMVTLMDVDGDGLPDQVFKGIDGNLYWRPNLGSGIFDSNVYRLNNITDFSHDNQKSNMTGGGFGLDAGVAGSIGDTVNKTEVNVKQDRYMMDVNGDGIPDRIDNGTVYFGVRQPDNTITYTTSSTVTAAPMSVGGIPNLGNLIRDANTEYLDEVNANPLVDTIKRWVAPFTGTITISSYAALITNTSQDAANYTTADGVTVTVQMDNTVPYGGGTTVTATELWRQPLVNDYSQHAFNATGLQVKAGDRIYFRVQSGYDGMYDRVQWNPQIYYQYMAPFTDTSGLTMTSYQASDDFTLNGSRGIGTTMQYSGTIRIAGALTKTAVTTDDVKLRIMLKHDDVINNFGVTTTVETIFDMNNADTDPSQTIPWSSSYGIVPMGNDGVENGLSYRQITVTAGDVVEIYTDIDSNIDIKKLDMHPVIYYISTVPQPGQDILPATDENGDYTFKTYAPYDAIFYPERISENPEKAYIVTKMLLNPLPIPATISAENLVLRLRGEMTKTGVTSQDVNIELIINSQVNGDGTFVEGTGTTVNIAVIPKDVIGTHFSLPDNFVVLTPNSTVTRSLLPLTNIRIKIITGTKADMDLISWDPKLRYSSMKYSTWSPEYIYQDLGPAVESPMPYEADLVNDNTTWIRNMAVRPVFTDTSGDTSSVNFTFTAKKYMELLGKGKITVSGGTAPAQNIMLSDIMVGDNVYFECFTNTLTNYAYITIAEPVYVPGVMPNFYPGVVTPGIIDKNADTLGDLFATPYRGWAVAGIKGNPDLSTYTADNLPDGYGPFSSPATLIDESKLSVSQYEGLTYTVSDIDQVEFAAIPGDPDKPGDTTDTISNTIDSWKAINEIYSTGTEMGSSRMGAKFIKKYSIADIIGDSAGGTQNAVMAMNRVSKSIQYGGSSSVVPGAFGSVGDSWSLADYIDMNGDGYPDFVSLSGGIQYTNPDGTMGNTITSFASGQDIRRSTAISFGVGTATNASVQLPTGQGDTGVSPDESISSNTGSQTVVASNAPDVSVGISGSGSLNISGGTSSSKKELMDMNGDGLPDMVEIDGNSINVYLNTGYGFATTPTYWNCTYTANVYIGESANAGGSAGAGIDLGVDVGPVGIGVSGGVVGGVTISKALEALVDVNGDGLPDYLDVNGNVYYNTGNGFGPPVPSGLDLTHGIGSSVNAGYSYGFSVSLRILVCYIGGSYSKSNGNSMSKQYDMLADINGDGFPDKISAIGSESMNVIYSSIGRTNLLQRVTRPMGATIDLDYQRSVNTHDMPRPRWNLKSVIVKDGVTADDLTPGSEDRITTYTYSGGKYDMLEREFYGYSWVTETAQLNSTDTRITARQYFDPTLNPGNDDYYLKGLLWHEYVYLNDAYNSNVLYYEKQNTYSEQKVFNQGLDYQFFADKYSYFPELSSTTETYHEGLTNLTKTNNYGYDSCGNITSFSEKGSESGSNDLVSAAVNYVNVNAGTDFTAASILNCTPTALNLAQNITVTDNAPGAPGRNRTATYDTIGNLTHVIQHSTGSEDSDTQMVYDNYGNLTSIIMPNNESNGSAQNYTMNFVYDTTTESQAITVSDSLYKSTADYNYMFGKPISTTDINNQSMNYYYDSYGRLTGVAGPNESSGQYAALYFYNPAAAVPNATTKNRDMANQPGTIDIITITDGLGRVIQTKKDATVAQQGSGLDALTSGSSMIVSGMEYYDNGGRKIRQYYPTYEAKTADNTALNTSIAAYYTNFIYDAYDRVHDVKMPDNTHTLFAYDSDGGRFRTIMTDANLNYKDTYKDTKQLIRMVKEFDKNDAGHPLITTYGYDAMGEITQVVEDSGNTNETTTITYDMLGRRTSINNPDTGLVTTVYDPASNVIKKITPDISPSAIQYHYDLNNRLTWIQYPASVNDVHYTYGSATGDGTNSAGRVNLVQYGMGSQQRSYDGLGNVTKLIDNITRLDNGENDTFTTLYTWDNTGRMLTMTYPTNDGQTEQLTYSYDKGGLVSGVTGAITGGPTTVYASNILYDEFEKRLEIDDGNAICTRYMYNGNDRRLGELITGVTNTAGTILYNIQDLHYSYDYVGNITMVANNMTKTYDDIPESVNRWFSYDGYNRLTSTAGTLHDNDAGLDRLGYSEAMAYDRIHNIISKQQNVSYLNSYAGAPQTNAGSTYNLTYNYNYNALSPAGPHAPTSIIDSIAPSKERDYKYDANGNQTGYTIGTTTPYAYQRTMSWDEENRLRSITETASGVPSLAEHYWYNDSGERIIKRTVNDNSGTMEYVNQFTSQATSDGVTGSLITKHIYVGNDRIASKVIPVGGLPKISAQTYYYHKDHLGSSGYITNSLGIIDEHEEYTPWGESWLEQKSAEAAGNSLNYYFTGKELDMTGMYYFGARYYDPKTSVWQSPDPILGKYLNDSKNQNSGKNGSGDAGGKGVFNIMNLALYSYAQQNPLILIDPDGKATVYVQKTGNYYYRDPSNGYTEYIGHGFAGRNDYKNKPDMQGKEKGNNYGPLPTGTYQIGGMQYDRVTDEGSKLPWSMELDQKGNYSSYLIHPDRKLDPGNGSKGCPIADKELGKVIDSDPDRTLIVVSNEDDVSNMAAPVVPYGESRDAQKNAADAIGQGEQHSEQQKKQ